MLAICCGRVGSFRQFINRRFSLYFLPKLHLIIHLVKSEHCYLDGTTSRAISRFGFLQDQATFRADNEAARFICRKKAPLRRITVADALWPALSR